jgi:hypothetical protein
MTDVVDDDVSVRAHDTDDAIVIAMNVKPMSSEEEEDERVSTDPGIYIPSRPSWILTMRTTSFRLAAAALHPR